MCFSSPQNDVAWRRHKEREAVAIADDGGMPPLYPQHNTGASSGGKDKGKGGGRLNQGDAGVCVCLKGGGRLNQGDADVCTLPLSKR